MAATQPPHREAFSSVRVKVLLLKVGIPEDVPVHTSEKLWSYLKLYSENNQNLVENNPKMLFWGKDYSDMKLLLAICATSEWFCPG